MGDEEGIPRRLLLADPRRPPARRLPSPPGSIAQEMGRGRAEGPSMRRKIVGYHQDEVGHWVADLDCGHPQHVRHQPPWLERSWVTTAQGRRSRLGMELDCKRCDEENLEPA